LLTADCLTFSDSTFRVSTPQHTHTAIYKMPGQRRLDEHPVTEQVNEATDSSSKGPAAGCAPSCQC
jgi:hypothetical protein